MPTEKVTFTIRWSGADRAELFFIIDNGKLKKANVQSDPGQLVITYEVEKAEVHVVTWSLLFPGETRSDLIATYTRDGGGTSPLDKVSQATDLWSSRGAA